MISESDALKEYGRSGARVIRRGEKDWKSDNHQAGRQGESYGFAPLSKMDQKIRQRARAEAPMELLPRIKKGELGKEIDVVDGVDIVRFVVVERAGVLVWKQRWRERGGAR